MRKKLIVLAAAVLVVAVSAVATSLAYFTSTADVANTFTVGNVEIKLDEAPVTKTGDKWTADENADRVTANEYKKIYPGAVLPKDPVVTNTGSYDAYVRVKVTINQASEWKSSIGANADLTSIFTFGDDFAATWKLAETEIDSVKNTVTYTYNYIKDEGILKGAVANSDGTTTEANTGALFTKVTVPAKFDNKEMEAIADFKIDIKAEAIQTAGFDSQLAAFNALTTQLSA
ncbi:MAG: SipW-dependent-type signal peptide-containing protein [Eubacteriales bacterium]